MENEIVPYDQALELKHLGFEYISTIFAYDQSRKLYTRDGIPHDFNIRGLLSAPTFSQAFRWFREKYNIIPNIHSVYIDETHTKINFWVWFANYEENSNEEIYYGTYEEAELECLKKLIEIVKNGKK